MNKIIEGMTILEQTPIKTCSTLFYVFFFGGMCVALGAIFVLAIASKGIINRKSKLFKGFLFFYIAGLVAMLSSALPFPWLSEETGRYTYECTLEDNISANYIGTNFDIIDVEDGVWTITDK